MRQTIVLARVVEESVHDGKPYARDLGYLPKFKTVRVPQAVVWLNDGNTADVEKAHAHCAQEGQGWRVFTMSTSIPDPLETARRLVLET